MRQAEQERPVRSSSATDMDHEATIREHAAKIAALESDVFNVCDIVKGDLRERMVKMQNGIDDIKDTLGKGNLQLQKLESANSAQDVEIAAIRKEQGDAKVEATVVTRSRWDNLIFPTAAAVIAASIVLIVEHFIVK